MRRLLLAAALPVLAGAACGSCSGAGAGTFPKGGRFLAQRVAGRTTTLVSDPARATYCPDDSILVIVALARKWTSGLAVRGVLPLTVAREFQVGSSLGGDGTATAAFRPLEGGAAQLGVGGTIRLEPAATVGGRFDVSLPDSAGARVSIRGRLSRIPLSMLPKGKCARTEP